MYFRYKMAEGKSNSGSRSHPYKWFSEAETQNQGGIFNPKLELYSHNLNIKKLIFNHIYSIQKIGVNFHLHFTLFINLKRQYINDK